MERALACQCGKRLAILEICSDLPHIAPGEVAEGIWFAKTQRASDWRQLICPQCGERWRGRASHITELVRVGLAHGVNRVTLETGLPPTPPPRPHRAPWSALRVPPDRAPQLIGARDTL